MRRIHALALMPFFALAACSSPAATSTSAAPASSSAEASLPASTGAASTAPAGNGEVLKGNGYTLTLPDGWKDATEAFQKLQSQVDTGGKDPKDTEDGFNDNVSVIAQTSPEIAFDTLKDALESQLQTAGSTNIEFKDNVQLDGAKALQVWSTTKGAEDGHTIQFMAFNDSKIFVITVSTNRSDAKAADLAAQVLSGWKWAA
ncbi:hypothetical protein [Micropruina sp.]|uniref:hypothetical protein n=1 Tax=Micropruina sp. TaxID=2737536 RepID=UPI0039E286AE